MNVKAREDVPQPEIKLREIEDLNRKIDVVKGILSNLLDRIYVLECSAGLKEPNGEGLFHNRDCLEQLEK